FIGRQGRLVTTPLSSPILAGITRDTILTLARELQIPVEERTFARDEMYIADEMFLTGTAAELTPVREVDDRSIGAGCPGPFTRRLQEAFFAVVKGATSPARHVEWLTYL